MVGEIGRRLPSSGVSSSCGLSCVLHGLLALTVLYGPQWLYGKPFTVPVNYEVTLISPGTPNSEQKSVPSLPMRQKVATATVKSVAQSHDVLTLPSLSRARTEEMTLSARRRSSERQSAAPPVTLPAPPKIVAPQVASAPGFSHPVIAPPTMDLAKAGAGQGLAAATETGVTVGNTDPAMAYYFVLIQDKITGNWTPPKMSPGTTAGVSLSLKILRSGQVRDLTVGSSSGDRLLDDSALRAVGLSIPLPPLPPLFKAEALPLELRFTFVGEKS